MKGGGGGRQVCNTARKTVKRHEKSNFAGAWYVEKAYMVFAYYYLRSFKASSVGNKKILMRPSNVRRI